MHFFPDPESPVINISYGRSEVYRHLELISALFSFVITSKLKVFVYYKNDITQNNFL